MYFLQKERTRKSRQHYIILSKTKITKATHHINLLKIEDEEHDNFHYVFIKGYSRLVGRQITKRQNKIHTCNHCLNLSEMRIHLYIR